MNKYSVSNARFQKLADSSEGQTLWAALTEHDNIIRLETAAELGHPAIEGVDVVFSVTPLAKFLAGTSKEAQALRQLAGMMTRDILQKNGYKLAPNKRTRIGRIFKSGATYFKGANLQKHACGQLLTLHHQPLGNGQVLIYYTPLDKPEQRLSVVDICPRCGERFGRQTLTDLKDDEHDIE